MEETAVRAITAKADAATRIALENETRQTLLRLEQKKIDLIREKARSREAAMKAKIDRIREEAKEERKTLLAQIDKNRKRTETGIMALQESSRDKLKKEREGLEREHPLQESNFDSTYKLQEDILKLREEIAKNQKGAVNPSVLIKLFDAFERTLKEIASLKRDTVSTEGDTAKVGQQVANVTQVPAPSRPV